MDAASDLAFPPDSQIWRLSRENALLLGGPAAAILQVAHPEIAAGVAAHSEFRTDALGRLHRTLDAVYTITFATRAEAEAMRRHIAAVHAKVRGSQPVAYDAFSLPAQMWVLATLIGVGTWIFEQLVSPLTEAECEVHYREMRVFGSCFGLDPSYGPQTAAEFRDYYSSMLNGSELASISLCREVAWAVAVPGSPLWLRTAARSLAGLTAETRPFPLRCGNGWDFVRRKARGQFLRRQEALCAVFCHWLPPGFVSHGAIERRRERELPTCLTVPPNA